MNQSKQAFQTSARKVQTVVPSALEMSIREVDWHRIYRGVKSVPRPTSRYQIVASFCFGICASAAIAIVPLYQTGLEIENWIKYVNIGAICVSLLVGLLLIHFSKKHEEFIKVNCESIKKDMADVYRTFFPNKDLEKEAT